MKQGFTLIELLVVVLIIGILSAVALPQYQKAVEKTRFMECVSAMERGIKAVQLFHLERGGGSYTAQELKDGSTIDLSDFAIMETGSDYFVGSGYCGLAISPSGTILYSIHNPWLFDLEVAFSNGQILYKDCNDESNEMGKFLCKSIEPLGWSWQENTGY